MSSCPPAVLHALQHSTRYGPYFTLLTACPLSGTHRLSDLYAGNGLAEVLGEVHAKLGGAESGVEPRVAASTFFLGWAAQLASPVLGCWELDGLLLDLDPARTHWSAGAVFAEDPRGRSLPDAAPEDIAAEVEDSLVARHFAPMVSAIAAQVRLAEPVLWGNAASAMYGALRVLRQDQRQDRPGHGRPAEAVVHALLERGRLAGTATVRPRFRRHSCCLFYRVPGGGLCGDCPLSRVPGTRSQHDHTQH